jgi:TPR repeat protein
MPNFDYTCLRTMLESGAIDVAMKVISENREPDSVAQLVAMARESNLHGESELSDRYLRLAERLVESDDLDGIAELFSAYRLDRLGSVDYQERDKLANKYLTLLAEAGNLFAQETLMIDYADGLHGLPVDISKFEFWAERAAANGSVLAQKELKSKAIRRNFRVRHD